MASRRKIQSVLRNLDFEKIHRYMVTTDWKWVTPHDPYKMEVPSVERIKEFVAEGVAKVIDSNENNVMSTSGGFWFIKNGKRLTVTFTIDSYDSW